MKKKRCISENIWFEKLSTLFKINGNQLSEAETVHDNYEKTITREHAR